MDLPCSRRSLWLHAGGTNPGSTASHAQIARPAIPPSPLRDSVGYSDHDRFRGYFPVHFIPAYNLPVYASQWPLPDPHARLGSRLLARLYRGRHLRRQSSTHLHGATRSDPCERNSRTRLPPWVSDGEALVAARRMRSSACDTVGPVSVPGPSFTGSHSPRPPPFAPPPPLRSGPLCSSASQLLWQSLTSRDRASSATAPRLPDADRRLLPNGRS